MRSDEQLPANSTSFAQREVWRCILSEVSQASGIDDWRFWQQNEHAMKSEVGDGNPLLDVVSAARSRAVRIVRQDHGDPPSFAAWVDEASIESEAGATVEELVIATWADTASLAAAREILAKWADGRPRDEVAALARRLTDAAEDSL